MMTAKEEMREIRISVALHLMTGVLMGVISFIVANEFMVMPVGIVIAVATGQLTQRLVGNKKFSWWFGNGLFLYLFTWLDVWIFMANIMSPV